MNTPVSYIMAKLLKEKGFEVKVRPMYYFDKSIHTGSYMYNANGELELCNMPEVGLRKGWIDSPTIADVVMWLYEKHGIWVVPDIKHTKGIVLHFGIDIWKLIPDVEVKYIPTDIPEDFLTPQEAYSAAFDYIQQNNLI